MPCRISEAPIRVCSAFAACLIAVLSCHAPGFPQDADPDAALRERVVAFWGAMQKEDYATATQLMHPDSRDAFQHRIPKSRVTSFRFEKVMCNPQRTECEATVMVKKPVAILNAGEVEWPLKSEWVLEQGAWYFRLPPEAGRNMMLEMFRSQAETAEKMAKENPSPAPAHTHAPMAPSGRALRSFAPDRANPQKVHRGEKAVFRFNLTNDTLEPLRIVAVHADCHCTSVASTSSDIPPGQTGSIQATLDTFGLPLGRISKEIHVTFADLADRVTIRLSAVNEPNFDVAPSPVDFGEVTAGKPAEKTLRIVNRSGKDVRLVHVNSSLRLTLSPADAVLAAGDELDIALRYSPAAAGEFVESVMLRTDLAAEPLITVLVKGKVVE